LVVGRDNRVGCADGRGPTREDAPQGPTQADALKPNALPERKSAMEDKKTEGTEQKQETQTEAEGKAEKENQGTQQQQQAAGEQQLYEVVIDGQKRQMTLDELKQAASLAEGSYKRLREASEKLKAAEQEIAIGRTFQAALQGDPEAMAAISKMMAERGLMPKEESQKQEQTKPKEKTTASEEQTSPLGLSPEEIQSLKELASTLPSYMQYMESIAKPLADVQVQQQREQIKKQILEDNRYTYLKQVPEAVDAVLEKWQMKQKLENDQAVVAALSSDDPVIRQAAQDKLRSEFLALLDEEEKRLKAVAERISGSLKEKLASVSGLPPALGKELGLEGKPAESVKSLKEWKEKYGEEYARRFLGPMFGG